MHCAECHSRLLPAREGGGFCPQCGRLWLPEELAARPGGVQPAGQDVFDLGDLRQLPYPVALTAERLLQALCSGADVVRQLLRLKDCFEATSKYLGVVLLTQYFPSRKACTRERNEVLLEKMVRPSLGVWVGTAVGDVCRWLAEDGAPGRINYVIQRPDGAEALGPVAATVGVLQNANHHLDVFDHTLLVIAYLENLFDDPVAGFLDPGALDQRVADDLRRQGIEFPAIARPIPAGVTTDARGVSKSLDAIRELYRGKLDDDARLALVWGALFHDVGKPATRAVNAHARKGDRIQFIGHEVYGWQLVREFVGNVLREVCPADGVTMVRTDGFVDWICPVCGHRRSAAPTDLSRRVEHFVRRHHDHHTLQNAIEENSGLLDTLKAVVAGQSCAPTDWKTWGKFMDAALADDVRIQFCRSLTKDFNKELGTDHKPLGDVLKKVHAWCQVEQTLRDQQDLPPLRREDALAKARDLLRDGDM